jgi:hypothetical protein
MRKRLEAAGRERLENAAGAAAGGVGVHKYGGRLSKGGGDPDERFGDAILINVQKFY